MQNFDEASPSIVLVGQGLTSVQNHHILRYTYIDKVYTYTNINILDIIKNHPSTFHKFA